MAKNGNSGSDSTPPNTPPDNPITTFVDQFDLAYSRPSYDVKKEDIGGLESILDKLEAFEMGIKHGSLYTFMGITPPNGFILSGEPGTGKTFIAKYLAQNLGARFVDLPLNEYESKWVGEAEKALSGHIENMRRYYRITNQKVLLFFDEAEEAFKDRNLQGWHGPRVNVLLREMDGLGDNRGIIFGAATNHIDKVDPALLRAGRFDFKIQMPEYDGKMLAEVYVAVAQRLNRKAPHHDPYFITLDEAKQLGQMAQSRRLSPADISEVFRLTAEEKVKQMVKTDKKVFESDDYIVVAKDLERAMEQYKKKEEKKRIGFNLP